MKILQYFFTSYLNDSTTFDDLEMLIARFKKQEDNDYFFRFITELNQIIQTKNYAFAATIIEKTELWVFNDDLMTLEKLLNYIYDRLTDKPTDTKGSDFMRNSKCILCPVCTPEGKDWTSFSLVQKATIIKNDMLIYICQRCCLVWLTEDILAENAHNYKKYMKSIGLRGEWKELRDIDTL